MEAEVVDTFPNSALLVIDMQNDYLHTQGLLQRLGQKVVDGDAVAASVGKLSDAARSWGIPVIYTLMTTLADRPQPKAWVDRRGTSGLLDLCMDGGWGQQIIEPLKPRSEDIVIKKQRFSAFIGTDLALVLQSLGVTHLVCAGVASNGCVDCTVRDGYQYGFSVTVAADAVGAYDLTLHSATIMNWSRRYADVHSVDTIVQHWEHVNKG